MVLPLSLLFIIIQQWNALLTVCYLVVVEGATTNSPVTTGRTTDRTTGVVTTVSPPHGDPFSYKWFFVGFATMLAIALIVVVLIFAVRKIAGRNAAGGPAFSPL